MQLGSQSKYKRRIEWKDSYSVGIEELDSQHRKLLELINQIGALAEKDLSKESCFAMLNAMIKYAQEHFYTEERYLEENAYPNYTQQKEAHESFVEDTFSMAQDLAGEGLLTLGGISIYLEDWYKDHILGFDQDYKAFFEKQAAKSDDPPEALPAETKMQGA